MADMADFINDLNWWALEDGYEEELEEEDGADVLPLMACKYCNQGGLHWIRTNKGWRLADNEEKIHNCQKTP